jgi:hypothetical protein
MAHYLRSGVRFHKSIQWGICTLVNSCVLVTQEDATLYIVFNARQVFGLGLLTTGLAEPILR